MPKEQLIKEVVLPFPLPTWNRILAMGVWQRKTIRHILHEMVATIINGDAIIEPKMEEYMKLIRPPARKKSTTKRERRK